MKKITALLLALTVTLSSLSAAIKVACVGDSITEGYRLPNPKEEAYPAQLAKKLGADYQVRNFGVGGRTLMNSGDTPYGKEKACREALAWKPDIVIIALGTNDSRPQNSAKIAADFAPDYKAFIGEFRRANVSAKIYVCLPPPVVGKGNWGITNETLENAIIPLVKTVAAEEQVTMIDFHSALQSRKECFHPDQVHPNAEGAAVLAETAAGVLSRM